MNNIEMENTILKNKIAFISNECEKCKYNGMGKHKALTYIKNLLDIKDWKICNGCNHNEEIEEDEYDCNIGCEPLDNKCVVAIYDKEKEVDICDKCQNNGTNACNHCDTTEGGGANYLPKEDKNDKMYIEILENYEAKILSDSEMVEAGFSRNEEGKYWLYDRILNLKQKDIEISFWLQIYDNGKSEFCLIDEDFCQPYRYGKWCPFYDIIEEETKKKIEQLESSGVIFKKKEG